jgi:hypothetical protein
MSVRPSVHMKQLDSHWRDFYEMLYLSIFPNFSVRIHVSLIPDKINRYSTWRPIHDFVHCFSEWKIFPTKLVQKISTEISCSIIFSNIFPLRDNMENYNRTRTDDNMAHAHCILNTLGYQYTLRICNSYWLSSTTIVARNSLDVAFYVHCPLVQRLNSLQYTSDVLFA